MVVMDTLAQYAVQYGLQAVVALCIFVAGVMASRWAGNFAQRSLERQTLDPPVRMLMVRIVKIVVLLFTAMIALQTLGVPIAPLVAGVGVAGVGIGLALQGVLSNVMAGLSIIFTKPYKVGEHISLLGVHGDVMVIDIFSTTLMHPDRSLIIIANRKIIGEILHNCGTIRQIHIEVGVAYSTNLDEALTCVRTLVSRHPKVLREPAPFVGVSALGDSAITIEVAPWVAVRDFVTAQAELHQAIVEQFRAQAIEIPFPQRDVHMLPPLAREPVRT
jgi:small conductance mechanosensitive channel